MNIYVNGTEKKLVITDPKTGCDWTEDCMDGSGDLSWNNEEDRWEMDQDAYEWWVDYLQKREAIENKIADLDDYIKGKVQNEINETYTEFNDFPDVAESAYREATEN